MVKTLEQEDNMDLKKAILRSVTGYLNKPKVNTSTSNDPLARGFSGSWTDSYVQRYDGEKNLGEVGPLVEYVLDLPALRMRSWKSYLDSEITQTNKFSIWAIGKGLKLSTEPVMSVLNDEDIDFEKEKFNKKVEARFSLFAKSKKAHIYGELSLHKLANEAFINSKIGGDVLVLLRVVKKAVKIQLIDGSHVVTPSHGMGLENENRINNGIQYDSNGNIEGYWVKKYTGGYHDDYEFIKAEVRGRKVAYMVYGLRYRIDINRGIPLISAVMETIAKMERYKEATVGSAEEVAKIAYQVVHQNYSTGENPVAGALAKALDADSNADGKGIPSDEAGVQLAAQVAATTNKQAYNNPIGAKIESMTSGNKELHFKDFYSTNINLICATLGIPPEVAMSKYDSNFSASRAALKDWENTLGVERAKFTEDFYQPIYDLWLDIQVLLGRISAPGYIEALKAEDGLVLEAYRNARFVGTGVPHIDPLKEVEAVRLKLGKSAENIPLVTVEQGVEELSGGDAVDILEQFASEYKLADSLGIKVVPDPVPVITQPVKTD